MCVLIHCGWSVLLLIIPSALCFDDGLTLADKATYAHNKVRYLHAVQTLNWDEELAQESESHAKVLAAENSLHHSEDSGIRYGENLYKGFDGFLKEKTTADAVFHWYLEINGYEFDNPAPNLDVHGHFTAVVWRSTSRFGCGIDYRDLYGGKMTFIVCRYRPAGNVAGLFLNNIMELRFGATIPTHPRQLQAPVGCIDRYKRCDLWINICPRRVFQTLMRQNCKKTCSLC